MNIPVTTNRLAKLSLAGCAKAAPTAATNVRAMRSLCNCFIGIDDQCIRSWRTHAKRVWGTRVAWNARERSATILRADAKIVFYGYSRTASGCLGCRGLHKWDER